MIAGSDTPSLEPRCVVTRYSTVRFCTVLYSILSRERVESRTTACMVGTYRSFLKRTLFLKQSTSRVLDVIYDLLIFFKEYPVQLDVGSIIVFNAQLTGREVLHPVL
jgi:hypothetical protein